jgi:hypothetical protein
MTLTVDQDCFECWPAAAAGPDDEHTVVVTMDDYDTQLKLCADLTINDKLYADLGCTYALVNPPCEWSLWVDCGELALHEDNDCSLEGSTTAGWPADAGVAGGPPEYGDWVLSVGQGEEPVEVAFTFAEVCEEEVVEEFVPEPGTIALLGSGLAGLAGYAALRWRARS